MKPNQDNSNQKTNNSFSNRQSKNQKPQMNLLNGELVALINGLIESIKEYYQVSLSNNSEEKNIILFYEEVDKSIQLLLNDISINNNNQVQKLNELNNKINTVNKVIFQLKNNSDSCLQNLKLFFKDAKLIFQHIREERQKQLIEKKTHENNINFQNNAQFFSNLKTQMINLYNRLVKSVMKFSDYDHIIEKAGDNSINLFQYLQNIIKNDLKTFFNLIQNLENINRLSLNSSFPDDSNKKRSKSFANNIEGELEKLRKMNNVKDNKIKQLMIQLNKLTNSKTEGNNSNNNFNILNTENKQNQRIKKLEQIILEKDNKLQSLIYQLNMKRVETEPNNGDIQNIIAEKDKEIINLQKQLNIYELNEQNFNKQLDDLNNQFQNKSMLYENEISKLKNNLAKYINNNKGNNMNSNINSEKNTISRTEYNQDLNFLENIQNINNEYISQITELTSKNLNLMKIIKKQKAIINGLQKEINNYKNKLAHYEQLNKNQMQQMNNNIYKSNKIIEQKDELIKKLREKKEIPNSQININMSNQSNNNELILLKIENEKLKNEINLLKLSPSNNSKYNNNNDNMNLLYNNNFPELQKLKSKLIEENNALKLNVANLEENEKLLTTNNEEFHNLYEQQKTKISKLESEVIQKGEQIKGLQDFIVKYQLKLENSNFYIPIPKANFTSKIQKKNKGARNDVNEEYTKTLKNY